MCLFQRKRVPLKILDHCKWPSEIMTVPWKCMAASALLKLQYALNRDICQIHYMQKIHACKSCSKIMQYPLRSWWLQQLSWNKEKIYSGKNCSLQLNTANYKEKMFFGNNYFKSQSHFMICHFTKIFSHLLIIAAVSNFNAFQRFNVFWKGPSKPRTRCEICSKWTIKTV